jgi:hypothetical protein
MGKTGQPYFILSTSVEKNDDLPDKTLLPDYNENKVIRSMYGSTEVFLLKK